LDARPEGTDIDLARLTNLYGPPFGYVTGKAEVRCRPTSSGQNTRLIVVGGSFIGGVVDAFNACDLFKQIGYYNYYDNWLRVLPGGAVLPVDRKSLDWRAKFAEPTAVVIELNEMYLGGDSMPWLNPFLDDALAALK
jgi:hypothetical protein